MDKPKPRSGSLAAILMPLIILFALGGGAAMAYGVTLNAKSSSGTTYLELGACSVLLAIGFLLWPIVSANRRS